MLTRKQYKENITVTFEPDFKECSWHPDGVLNMGQRKVTNHNTTQDILLTMDDLSFYPNQNDLRQFVYYAPQAVYDKFYKPFYTLMDISKSGKVEGTTLVLRLLERN